MLIFKGCAGEFGVLFDVVEWVRVLMTLFVEILLVLWDFELD